MVCPKCGSTNVQSEQKQVANDNIKFKTGNGCLWWLLLGWLYVLYLALRLVYYIFIGWWVSLIQKSKKNKEDRTVVHICQNCGYRWESVSEKKLRNPVSATTNTADTSSKELQQDDMLKRSKEKLRKVVSMCGDRLHREEPKEEPVDTATVIETVSSRGAAAEPPHSTELTYEGRLIRTTPKKASSDDSDSNIWHRPSATGFDDLGNNNPS
jgi:predicted nucleic-acid-binding Zn-ribbon protein